VHNAAGHATVVLNNSVLNTGELAGVGGFCKLLGWQGMQGNASFTYHETAALCLKCRTCQRTVLAYSAMAYSSRLQLL
jgi:hypothetical protein